MHKILEHTEKITPLHTDSEGTTAVLGSQVVRVENVFYRSVTFTTASSGESGEGGGGTLG